MLRAVFVRTLKSGVTYEQFRDAWVPETRSDARERLGEIVQTTELEGVYEEVFGPASFGETTARS